MLGGFLLAEEGLGVVGWTAVIGAIGSAIVLAAGAIGTQLGKWAEVKRANAEHDARTKKDADDAAALRKKESHADAIKDYKELYLISQKEKAEQKGEWRKEIHDLRDDFNREKLALHAQMATDEKDYQRLREDDNRRCDERIAHLVEDNTKLIREIGKMEADIRGLQTQLRYVESMTGTSPRVPLPGIIVADYKGIVRVFSPSLTGFLGWEPDDVQGNSIRMIIPDDHLPAHDAAMKMVVEGKKMIDPSKGLNTHAKHKDGKRTVPITIYLDDRMLKDSGMIAAYVYERSVLKGPLSLPAASRASIVQAKLPIDETSAPEKPGNGKSDD